MPTRSTLSCLFLIAFILADARAEDTLEKPPAALEATLKQWQRDSAKIKTLECEFEVWENDPVFDKRTHRSGRFHYQSPNKAAFRIEWNLSGEKPKEIKNQWWIRDGRSCYYGDRNNNSKREQIVEIRLSNEALAQTLPFRPLPFLFGTTADEWKQYGVLSETTTDQERALGQTWLSLLPRDPTAQGISKAELILTLQTDERLLLPMAVKLHWSNTKCDETYSFKNLQMNHPQPKAGSDPFKRRFSRHDGEHVVVENLGNGDWLGPHISRYPLWLPLFPDARAFAD